MKDIQRRKWHFDFAPKVSERFLLFFRSLGSFSMTENLFIDSLGGELLSSKEEGGKTSS